MGVGGLGEVHGHLGVSLHRFVHRVCSKSRVPMFKFLPNKVNVSECKGCFNIASDNDLEFFLHTIYTIFECQKKGSIFWISFFFEGGGKLCVLHLF